MARLFCLLLAPLVACFPLRSSVDAGVSYRTISVAWPQDTRCLNDENPETAKEIVIGDTLIVAVAGGDNPIPDSVWEDFSPGWGNRKNSTRNLQFDDSCFARSPWADEDCEGEDCASIVEVKDYTWIELSQILAVDCLPGGGACNPQSLQPGELAMIVTRKCHRLTFVGEQIFLVGPQGEEAVLHASAGSAAPTTDVELPDGWSLERRTLDEPLTIHPFGGEGACCITSFATRASSPTTRSPTRRYLPLTTQQPAARRGAEPPPEDRPVTGCARACTDPQPDQSGRGWSHGPATRSGWYR